MARAVDRDRLGAWLLKANPAVWDLRGFLDSGERRLTSWAVRPGYRSALMQPGDRVLFYSDGVIEARPKGGPQFGVERLIDDAEEYLGGNLAVSEVLRRLVRRLREHRGGELEDDATLVFLEWQPGRP